MNGIARTHYCVRVLVWVWVLHLQPLDAKIKKHMAWMNIDMQKLFRRR